MHGAMPTFTEHFASVLGLGQDNSTRWPTINKMTVIGISTAITGNVLISLALNIQKMAHKRVELARWREQEMRVPNENGTRQAGGRRMQPTFPEDESGGHAQRPTGDERDHNLQRDEDVFGDFTSESHARTSPETEALLAGPRPRIYGSWSRNARARTQSAASDSKGQNVLLRLFTFSPQASKPVPRKTVVLPVEVVSEAAALSTPARNIRKKITRGGESGSRDANEAEYLKSKLWWLGFLLINVGELGNFVSYAFAPASVVAPLGTFALIANCFFAPLMLDERFRKRDLLGVLIAVVGAVTVVLSSNASNVQLDPKALIHAISQRAFVVYAAIYAVGAVILAVMSEGRIGRQNVLVDVGLCGLFGGFTVLSTKGISTLLTMEWFEVFTEWITYPIIIVLLFTGIGQVKYLNRALMRFDSKVVIPIQFVFFNLSAIVGSAILYDDFRRATFHQFLTFIYGCIATFAGVFVLASAGDDSEPAEGEVESEVEVGREGSQFGSLSRGTRPTIMIPNRGRQNLNHRHSSVGLGLSPAKLLLVQRDSTGIGFRDADVDVESEADSMTGSVRRKRTISWFGGTSNGTPVGSLQERWTSHDSPAP